MLKIWECGNEAIYIAASAETYNRIHNQQHFIVYDKSLKSSLNILRA